MTTIATSVFAALGGEPAIDAAVELFYDKILADPELAPFFARVRIERQKSQMRAFLATALGGPDAYRGRDMEAAHRRHAITDHHFDLVAGHLVATLVELGIDEDLVGQVVAVVGPLRADVVRAEG
jgi:hemoglobin